MNWAFWTLFGLHCMSVGIDLAKDGQSKNDMTYSAFWGIVMAVFVMTLIYIATLG